MKELFAIYDALLDGPGEERIQACAAGTFWTGVQTEHALGLAMTTAGDTAPRLLSGDYAQMTLRQLARGVKSWNYAEAGFAMAAVNAWYNTLSRLDSLDAREPYEHFCTRGLDLTGKRLGLVGHLRMPREILTQAGEVFILERDPRPGDYPDAACDWILPTCDVVIITASTLVNKTLPHLLTLCGDAYTILTGPTCPMCPALLELGLDRLSGMVVQDQGSMLRRIREDLPGPPYPLGQTFLLSRDRV